MQINSDTDFTLSIDSVQTIPFAKYEKNFTFIVDNKKYHTNRIIADLLSPIIQKYHYTDESLDSFIIDTQVQHPDCDFSDILSLLSFEKKHIKRENLEYFINIFFALGNKQEFYKLIPKCQEEITEKNVFERIRIKQKYFQLFELSNHKNNTLQENYPIINQDELINSEIDFIASNFFEINLAEVKKLDPFLIENIINNPNLKLDDEDSLFHFIIDLYSSNHSVSYMFEYINFANVSNDEIRCFSEMFQLEDINGRIWNSLIERTINSHLLPQDTKSNRRDHRRYTHRTKEIQIPYDEQYGFSGIFKYLIDKTGGNIHDNGTIEVYSDTVYSNCQPKYLLDFDDNSFYEASGKNASILFDFKDIKVQVSSYSIKSFSSPPNAHHLKDWVIEVSNDEENWEIIDRRINCSTLNQSLVIGTFEVKENNFSRFVRLRQIGELWGGGNMWLHGIELYGSIQCK